MSARQREDEPITQAYTLSRPNEFTKIDLKPRRFHFFNVLLFIFGTIFPPIAVAARFGFGSDFLLNILLTVCGYIPGHAHNFYIQSVGLIYLRTGYRARQSRTVIDVAYQSPKTTSLASGQSITMLCSANAIAAALTHLRNIRNNSNNRRTPKWAVRYGLVDDSEMRRKKKRSQWANRYNDRLPQSALEGQEYAEGQVPDGPRDDSTSNIDDGNERPLWDREEDETYYGRRNRDHHGGSSIGSGGRWHYPANFDEADAPTSTPTTSKRHKLPLGGGKKKKDRWALSEDARMGVLPDEGESKARKRKKKSGGVKRSKKRSDAENNSSLDSRSDVVEPEDPVGGLYGERRATANGTAADPQAEAESRDQELFEHQF